MSVRIACGLVRCCPSGPVPPAQRGGLVPRVLIDVRALHAVGDVLLARQGDGVGRGLLVVGARARLTAGLLVGLRHWCRSSTRFFRHVGRRRATTRRRRRPSRRRAARRRLLRVRRLEAARALTHAAPALAAAARRHDARGRRTDGQPRAHDDARADASTPTAATLLDYEACWFDGQYQRLLQDVFTLAAVGETTQPRSRESGGPLSLKGALPLAPSRPRADCALSRLDLVSCSARQVKRVGARFRTCPCASSTSLRCSLYHMQCRLARASAASAPRARAGLAMSERAHAREPPTSRTGSCSLRSRCAWPAPTARVELLLLRPRGRITARRRARTCCSGSPSTTPLSSAARAEPA